MRFAPAAAVAPAPPARLTSCTAFVPVHDEAATIVGVTEALRAVLRDVSDAWDVVVVDDGSRDGTAALVDALAATHRDVRVVRHAVNRGYGAAVRAGLAAARGDWIFFTDGDGQFDPSTLRDALPALGTADALVGYRAVRADPWRRRVLTAGWNALVRRLLGVQARDVNCAFKLVRRRLVDDFAGHADGGAVSAELLAHLAARGARIVEVPVPHHPRRAGVASGGRPAVALRAVAELVAVWWRRRR